MILYQSPTGSGNVDVMGDGARRMESSTSPLDILNPNAAPLITCVRFTGPLGVVLKHKQVHVGSGLMLGCIIALIS